MQYTEEAIEKRKQKEKTIKKTVSIIIYIIIIPLLVYNISLMIQAVTNPSKTPNFFGIKTYTIVSGSMEPELQIGDIVIVKELNESDIQVGDIISFRQGQSVVTHRIVEIKKNDEKQTYVTQGDNNNVEDKEETEYDMIEGKLVGKIPFLGKISQLLQGKITVVIIALITYIYYAHSSKINRIKNRRKAKRLKYEEDEKEGE